jgi:hypothetical protein
MSAFQQVITNLEQYPNNFYELHHIFWKDTSEIVVVGVEVYCYSAISWLRIALNEPLCHFRSDPIDVPIVNRFRHNDDVNVEFMCMVRVTDLIKGIHYELFVNLQIDKCKEAEKYFALFRRAQNRLFEIVQQEEFAKDFPENYNCKEYFKDRLTSSFAFDMDSYCTSINRLHHQVWELGQLDRPSVDASEIKEHAEQNIDSMESHFLTKMCEQSYLMLIDATVYYRIYTRCYPYVDTERAPRKSVILASLPHVADYLPKELSEWKEEKWSKYLNFTILRKMGNSLIYDRYGADPVKKAWDCGDLSFQTHSLDFMVSIDGKKYLFDCSLSAYTFLSQNKSQCYPKL